jgi:hypothetical protein
MAGKGSRYGCLLSENIFTPRRRFRSVGFAGLCLGWRAIEHMIEALRHKWFTQFRFALAVRIFHHWSQARRAQTHSQS